MAETLGSLVDKLTIKNIRLSFLRAGTYSTADTDEKIRIVDEQRADLVSEIDDFLAKAVRGEVKLKELKVKLYKNPAGQVSGKGLGELISELSKKNLELWGLEDEVRRTDISDSSIALTKRNIDRANQERNDLIDSIDAHLEKVLKDYEQGARILRDQETPRYSVK